MTMTPSNLLPIQFQTVIAELQGQKRETFLGEKLPGLSLVNSNVFLQQILLQSLYGNLSTT
jgi:hypothetical protein